MQAETRTTLNDSDLAWVDEAAARVRARLAAVPRMHATYRLQFQAGRFLFSDARSIAGYLADLGISHIYASPYLQSRRGSSHGYVVVDHSRLNAELGGDAEYERFVEEARRRGLGQILDIVPNHMSVAGDENAWWLDVLMNGPASPQANHFDVDWAPLKSELRDRVLLPVLGDLYGRVLESGELPLAYRDGALFVSVYGAFLPLDPQTWGDVLAPGLEALEETLGAESAELLEFKSILNSLQYLPARSETAPERVEERSRERTVIQRRLQQLVESSPPVREHVEGNLRRINGIVGEPGSFDGLDRLLDRQAYRLVHWKAGSDELNYRRFFDVTELAALCMEHLDVFQATHRLVLDLAVGGKVDGFRIDHIDGLFDPPEYLWRLQWGYAAAVAEAEFERLREERGEAPDREAALPRLMELLRPDIGGPSARRLLSTGGDASEDATSADASIAAQRPLPLFVLVEKILGAEEPLPTEWPVEGTTGYDFLNLLNGMFVDPRGLTELRRNYLRFTEEPGDLEEIAYLAKRLILSTAMQSEIHLLAHRLDRISNRHRRSRDYTRQALRFALREIIACFPIYRTYIHNGHVSERDRRIVQRAVAQAKRRNPAAETMVFEFVRDVLLLAEPPDLSEEGRQERDLFIGRFQQVTSPVMAKGVEDTAFYQYIPLTSLDEVGGEPAHAVTSVDEFHTQTLARCADWPRTMLATTTHDTKRTEDVRARLNVLSEVAGQWRTALSRWARLNRRHRREVDGLPAPSRNDEWLFYQSLLGIWPLSPPSAEEREELKTRLQDYMLKATHEAKLRTSWISPNAAYDDAVRSFVAGVLDDPAGRFLQDFLAFHESIADAGLYASLAQTLLKLVSPGIPDIYQGQELWDFSLVDPDNRRRVDYDLRRSLLAELREQADADQARGELAWRLARNPRDPRTKLFLTWTALEFRRNAADGFAAARYVPLEATGAAADHVCAFALEFPEGTSGPGTAIVVVPRLAHTLLAGTGSRVPCGTGVWRDTAVVGIERQGDYRNLMTGGGLTVERGTLAVGAALETFPVALLAQPAGQ
ncbi:MAG: malto-oligosyltrehalose synthase [Planctomyces sp.]|nr:malto-oligosyltrehalose synthase [Planctomyces sp.]